ncbi:MAG: type VII secretion protein EssB [Bacillus sp. (in: firmicutes)]
MPAERESYLKERLNVVITKENHIMAYHFQRARLKLNNCLEIQPLKENETSIEKKIQVTEDEVTIEFVIPPAFFSFFAIQERKEKEKWLFAYQLTKKVINHSLKRFIPVICPDNMVFDTSYTPYLLHYGVKDSLIPFDYEEEQILLELKATICTAIEGKYNFEEYMRFSDTLKIGEEAKQIMQAASFDEISDCLENKIRSIEENEKTLITVSNKRWNLQRYTLIGFIVCFIPALIYIIYSFAFMIPKQEAYVESNQAFLERNYSEVITLLEEYDPETMPYVVLYQLASSYVASVALNDEQKQTIVNSLTLQADQQYFYYWIYIGRGMSDQALMIARTFGDPSLIVYALYNYEEELKRNTKLKAEEKQELLDEITLELDEYKRMKEQEQSETVNENDSTTTAPPKEPTSGTNEVESVEEEKAQPGE